MCSNASSQRLHRRLSLCWDKSKNSSNRRNKTEKWNNNKIKRNDPQITAGTETDVCCFFLISSTVKYNEPAFDFLDWNWKLILIADLDLHCNVKYINDVTLLYLFVKNNASLVSLSHLINLSLSSSFLPVPPQSSRGQSLSGRTVLPSRCSFFSLSTSTVLLSTSLSSWEGEAFIHQSQVQFMCVRRAHLLLLMESSIHFNLKPDKTLEN